MIDEVIICGVRRAKEKIEIGEIKQSIGRAGRSYTKSGTAIVLCPSADLEYAESCIYETTPPIVSELTNIEQIAFHILPWIQRIYDEESFQNWFSRSLASIQNTKITWKELSTYLIENNCIDEEYNITPFGNISIKTYFEPAKLISLKDKLLEAQANGNILEPVTLSYILANDHISVSNVNFFDLYEYKSSLSSNGYIFNNGELIQGYAYYCVFKNLTPKWIRHVIKTLKDDFSRTLNALSMIAEYENLKEISDEIKTIEIAVLRNVNMELAHIIKEFNLEKKASAYELKELEIYNKEDLQNREMYLIRYATESLKKDLQKQGFLQDLLLKEWRNK